MNAAPAIAVIVPTYNERPNIGRVVDAVRAGLEGEDWELVFVDDDSPDGTWREIDRLGATDRRVRRLRRVGRRGLASASIEGVMATSAPWVAIMDGDAQHDPVLLRDMLRAARERNADVVIATRAGAGREDFRSPLRRFLTRAGNRLGRLLVRNTTTDPLSGYFLARRELFDERAGRLYGAGFKILVDLLSAGDGALRIEEIPMQLKPRAGGESKLRARVAVDYAFFVARRSVGRLLPLRFVLYAAVGTSGVGVHLAVLQLAYALFGEHFAPAQLAATMVAMTTNFFLNNLLTFRDRMLSGPALWRGLLRFYLACSTGALVSLAIGEWVHTRMPALWVAGLAGAAAAAVWNFTLNERLTWGSRR